MKEFDKIIIGASCWSAGQVLQGETGCLVIDRHASIGHEYFETFRECAGMTAPLTTSPARKLQNELAACGKPGDPLLLAPFLYAELHNLTGQFRLWTEITGIRRETDGWLLSICDVEGVHSLFARELIDCTPECVSQPEFGRGNIVECRLNAIILAPDLHEWTDSGFDFRKGRTDDEFILSLKLEPETGWTNARRLLLDRWRKRPADLDNARICVIGGAFEYRVRRNSADLGENYHYFNSAMFANPLAAIDHKGGGAC